MAFRAIGYLQWGRAAWRLSSIVFGNPSKVIHPATEEEIALNVESTQTCVEDIKRTSR